MLDKYKNKKIVAVIPARMQSSRFYGKPLAKILGKEMIQWVYEICQGCTLLKEVYVATDHEDIKAFCIAKKIPYMMTSDLHRNCAERSDEVAQKVKADYIVEVQGDEPTLVSQEIDDFVSKAFDYEHFDVVTQYTPITLEEAKNPNNVKLVVGHEGRAVFFSRSVIPFDFKGKNPAYYKQVGLYVWPATVLERYAKTPKGYLENCEDTHMLRLIEYGFDARLVKTEAKSVGVDIPSDIAMAEEFLRNRDKKTAVAGKG